MEWRARNPLPCPAGHSPFDAAWDKVGFVGCTLLHHVELLVNQQLQVILRTALKLFSAQPVVLLGIALTHGQDLELGIVELTSFVQSHLSNISWSPWMTSLPSNIST